MRLAGKITPCLWFDDQAEAAAKFYTGIFPGSRIVKVTQYTEAGRDVHGQPAGKTMTVAFELAGQPFTALNGGPAAFRLSEAISFEVPCETQEQVDYFWEKLRAGGDPKAEQCGWLKDRFGVSWQIVPVVLKELLGERDPAKAGRVMNALLEMKKLDIAALQRAHAG